MSVSSVVTVEESRLNGKSGSFPAVQPISNIYTLSLWLAPEYEGQLSANSCPSRATNERQVDTETGRLGNDTYQHPLIRVFN